MTKTEKILDLTWKFPKMTSHTIADRVGCHHAYVRAVWHRNGKFRRKHDPTVDYSRRVVPAEAHSR